ncbi:MAG: hypothetical protein JXR70_14565 [Spirochaetales bacterium]|nr:hypothetical protein [Spirochaetales bacterium]
MKNPFHLNIDQEQGRYAHFKTKNWTLKAIQPNLLDFGSSSKNRVHYFLQKIILQTGKALQGYTETVKNKFQGQIFVEK